MIRPHPYWGESLIRLATELKHLQDMRNDPGDTPYGAAGAKLDSKPVDM